MMNGLRILFFLCACICCLALDAKPAIKTQNKIVDHSITTSISSNPAAVNVTTGSGALQRYLQEKISYSG